MVVTILLIFPCQSSITDMIKIFQPFKVGDSYTTSINVQILASKHIILWQKIHF